MTAPQALLAGRYRLVRLIATGGMGVVWEGWDEVLERPVAVKQLRTELGVTEAEAKAARKRAMREARITARLHHPHAVPVFDAVEHEGQPCLIMQYLPSTPLSAVIRERGPLTPGDAVRIGADVASALAAAHRLGIVHRDVKPGNILLDEQGSALISDFGISHATGDSTVTSTGLVHGTPAYLAPEVARGGRPDFASDVFSLGSTLYAAVEGAPPFGMDTNSIALLHRVATGSFDPPTRSGSLTPLVTAMLSPEPADRPTMQDAATHLAELAEQARREHAATAVLPAAAAAAMGDDAPEPDEPREGDGGEQAAEPVKRTAEEAPDQPLERPDDVPGEEPDGFAALGLHGRAAPEAEPEDEPEPEQAEPEPPPAPIAAAPRRPVPSAASKPATTPAAPTTARLPVQEPSPRPAAPAATVPTAAAAAAMEESPRRRRGALIAILAVAAVLVLVVGGLLLSRVIPSGGDGEAGGAGAPASESPTSAPSEEATGEPADEPSSAPTPSAAPSTSAPAPTPTPPPTPPPPTREERLVQAVTGYYGLMPGDRDAAWPLMTTDYQEHHAGGRGAYERFWNGVSAVSVSEVTASPPDGAQAVVTYTYTNGSVVDELTAYRFVDEGGTLKIAATDVLSSASR